MESIGGLNEFCKPIEGWSCRRMSDLGGLTDLKPTSVDVADGVDRVVGDQRHFFIIFRSQIHNFFSG